MPDLAAEPEDDSHSGKEDKAARHRIFCEWIIETFGKASLMAGSGVMDVAGGKGDISHFLTEMGITSTCIEPFPRSSQSLSESLVVDTDDNKAPPFKTLERFFDEDLLNDSAHVELFQNAAFYCGMHPDQVSKLNVISVTCKFLNSALL